VRVLIATNEPVLSGVICRFLRAKGHDARAAAGADGAHRAMVDPDWRPDAVVADCSLAGDPVTPLLERWQGGGPFVVLVGRGTGPADPRAAELATATLEKPFDPVDLLGCLG
jgi:DNA-binding response OmpR family regulator